MSFPSRLSPFIYICYRNFHTTPRNFAQWVQAVPAVRESKGWRLLDRPENSISVNVEGLDKEVSFITNGSGKIQDIVYKSLSGKRGWVPLPGNTEKHQ